MYFIIKSVYLCYIMNEFKSLPRCKACGRDSATPNYSGVHFRADKFLHRLQRPNAKSLNRWPMSLGSIRSLLLHEDVVKQLIKDEVASGSVPNNRHSPLWGQSAHRDKIRLARARLWKRSGYGDAVEISVSGSGVSCHGPWRWRQGGV
jgi:hypothetical protein